MRQVRVTRAVLVAIGLAALAIVLWQLSGVITVAFGGVIGAAILRGLALPLSRRTGLPESASILVTLAALLILFVLLGWLFGPQAVEQTAEMQRLLPEAARRLIGELQRSAAGKAVVGLVGNAVHDSRILSGVGFAAGAAITALGDALLIFFLSIYFAWSPVSYVDGFLRLMPPERRPKLRTVLMGTGDALRRWLIAQLVGMTIVGVLVGAALGLVGEPLALLLGVVAFFLEFIPVIGPILFGIPGILVAFSRGPRMALTVFIVYVAVQQLESNLICPLLQRWAVRISPAITLLSVVVGGVLLGLPGAAFATPIAVVAMCLVQHLYVEDTLEDRWRHGGPIVLDPRQGPLTAAPETLPREDPPEPAGSRRPPDRSP